MRRCKVCSQQKLREVYNRCILVKLPSITSALFTCVLVQMQPMIIIGVHVFFFRGVCGSQPPLPSPGVF